MKKFYIGGIIGAVIAEITLFIVTYVMNLKISKQEEVDHLSQVVSMVPFPPDFAFIAIALIVGFSVGGVIGLLIEHFKQKNN